MRQMTTDNRENDSVAAAYEDGTLQITDHVTPATRVRTDGETMRAVVHAVGDLNTTLALLHSTRMSVLHTFSGLSDAIHAAESPRLLTSISTAEKEVIVAATAVETLATPCWPSCGTAGRPPCPPMTSTASTEVWPEVAENTETLPLPELIEELRLALVTKDRASLTARGRYGHRRQTAAAPIEVGYGNLRRATLAKRFGSRFSEMLCMVYLRREFYGIRMRVAPGLDLALRPVLVELKPTHCLMNDGVGMASLGNGPLFRGHSLNFPSPILTNEH